MNVKFAVDQGKTRILSRGIEWDCRSLKGAESSGDHLIQKKQIFHEILP